MVRTAPRGGSGAGVHGSAGARMGAQEEASVAGESPDRSEQRESSEAADSGSDPRLGFPRAVP